MKFPFVYHHSAATAILLTSMMAFCGCNMAAPEFRLHAADGLSAELAEAIVFRVEPAPVDERIEQHSVLRLPDAILAALRTDPRIQVAIAKVRIAQAEAHQTQLLPNPVLNLAIRFAEGGGNPTIEASVAADLLSLLQRPGRMDAGANRLRGATADALSVILDVWRDVQECYLAAQAAEMRADILSPAVEVTDRHLTRTQARLDRGEATRLDLSALTTQRLDFQLQLANAQIDLRMERLRLARLIGTPSDAAAWQLEASSDPDRVVVPENILIRTALQHRPEIQASHWELAALGAESRLARWYWTEEVSPGLNAESEGAWAVGPSLSAPIPLFDWGQARRERFNALIQQAGHELVGKQRQIVEETRVAYATLTASREAARRIQAELLPLLRQRREDSDAAFAAGKLDVTTLLLAERDLQDARARLADLDRKTRLAMIDLQRAVGGPAILARAPANPDPSSPQTEAASATGPFIQPPKQ